MPGWNSVPKEIRDQQGRRSERDRPDSPEGPPGLGGRRQSATACQDLRGVNEHPPVVFDHAFTRPIFEVCRTRGVEMKNRWVGVAFAAVLGSTPVLASATVVNLTGWTFGSGNTVNVTSPSDNGPAGGFTGSISGFGAAFDSASFQTYCVELTQYFYLPSGPMTGYSIMTPAAYGEWARPAATANRIGQLITYVNANPTAVSTSAESTSLQLAIWNSIYDTDNTLLAGSFKDTSGFAAYANTLLSDSLSTVSD